MATAIAGGVSRINALLGSLLIVLFAGCAANELAGVESENDAGTGGSVPESDGGKADDPGSRIPETCGNGIDDNHDGQVDEKCACTLGTTQTCWPGDPAQRRIGACKDGKQTCYTDDGEFNKWSACEGAVLPSPDTTDDGIDQDCDGDGGIKVCTPVAEVCTDGKDNDCDGKIDCSDSNCSGTQACAPVCQPVAEVCNDGKDNDCDGKVDCSDSNCSGNQACAPVCHKEWNREWDCTDGKDDDCNGKTDCDDPECMGEKECTCDEKCTVGAVRWCDEAQFCSWGKQTCGPNHEWGACKEVTNHPNGCGDTFYDEDCCVDAGQCCQAMHLLTPLDYSVGTCQPVTVSCSYSN